MISISFIDQMLQIYPLFPMLLMLCAGIGAIVFGSYVHNHPGKLNRGRKYMQQMLLTWQVEQPGASDPAVLEEFIRSQDFIQSSAIIGVGLAAILTVSGTEILLWTLTGSWDEGVTWLFMPALFLTYLLGYGSGYLYGVWHLRQQGARGVTYADLQPRGLADYRSRVFPLAASALIAGVTLLTILVSAHLGPQVPIELVGGATLQISRWIFWAVPAAMLLTLLIAERIMAYIADIPRLFVTSQPQTSQQADNLLRALTIGTLQGYELIVIAGFAEAQILFMMSSLFQSGFWHMTPGPYSAFLNLEFGFALVVVTLGFIVQMLYGRLGGRISGWPWRRMPTP
ncbi:MAG: hypothetical protein ACLQUY_16070 [Ktedonobacterales bacterium]